MKNPLMGFNKGDVHQQLSGEKEFAAAYSVSTG
jgi:hypothetical protein